jgi:hypothetical protein
VGGFRTLIAHSLHCICSSDRGKKPTDKPNGPRGLAKKRPHLKLTGALDAAFDEPFEAELTRLYTKTMGLRTARIARQFLDWQSKTSHASRHL